ncbi:hypothetical protein AC579_9151 [Pseudocercospora musae]|uniref:Uncharacterized protein n=1 Tax=Pseudocercospora musae TaxID=113226 RepID=A0A139I6K0_9PEZI|nr:hypothetical protein AC579_9151 [Pseudocercospora musae]
MLSAEVGIDGSMNQVESSRAKLSIKPGSSKLSQSRYMLPPTPLKPSPFSSTHTNLAVSSSVLGLPALSTSYSLLASASVSCIVALPYPPSPSSASPSPSSSLFGLSDSHLRTLIIVALPISRKAIHLPPIHLLEYKPSVNDKTNHHGYSPMTSDHCNYATTAAPPPPTVFFGHEYPAGNQD